MLCLGSLGQLRFLCRRQGSWKGVDACQDAHIHALRNVRTALPAPFSSERFPEVSVRPDERPFLNDKYNGIFQSKALASVRRGLRGSPGAGWWFTCRSRTSSLGGLEVLWAMPRGNRPPGIGIWDNFRPLSFLVCSRLSLFALGVPERSVPG